LYGSGIGSFNLNDSSSYTPLSFNY
jgi:hypothetical protein